jgi:oligopeptide transport system substrate-binding protein
MLTHQATYASARPMSRKFGADFIKPGNLVSNGAYMLAEFVPNDHIKVVKNPNFYDAANVQIDTVNYIPTEDRSTAMKRLEAGELDSNDDIPTEQLAELKAKFGDQVRIGPYLGTYYYVFKTDKEPWKNVKLRHAVSMAIDRDYLAEKVWQNTMVPAYSLVPPGISGYEARPAEYAEKTQLDREDEAKKTLAELGYGPGQAAEDGNPLQHLGKPQEHGRGHPGTAEAAGHRSDDGQHRHQDPLWPSGTEG